MSSAPNCVEPVAFSLLDNVVCKTMFQTFILVWVSWLIYALFIYNPLTRRDEETTKPNRSCLHELFTTNTLSFDLCKQIFSLEQKINTLHADPRIADIEKSVALLHRRIQCEDVCAQVLIGFHMIDAVRAPIVCPKAADDLYKYIPADCRLDFFLPCLSMLPNIKHFDLAKIYQPSSSSHGIRRIIDHLHNVLLQVPEPNAVSSAEDLERDRMAMEQIRAFCAQYGIACT
jgi:hypothetical protein